MSYYDGPERLAKVETPNSLRSFTHTKRLQNEKTHLEERLKNINRALEILTKYPDIEELLNCLVNR